MEPAVPLVSSPGSGSLIHSQPHLLILQPMKNRRRGEGVQNRLVGVDQVVVAVGGTSLCSLFMWIFRWKYNNSSQDVCESKRTGGCHQREAERLSGLIPSSCYISTIAAHNSPAVCKLQFHSMAMWWWGRGGLVGLI